MTTHKHKWEKDPYGWGYCCECGAWSAIKNPELEE